jgi:hypothetical protein
MSIEGKRTVWLIEAGFSRSLGGPLFADLFRPRFQGDDEQVFPPEQYPTLARDLYVSRLHFNGGKEEGWWRDAEDFLSFLDSAYRNVSGPKKGMLQMIAKRVRSQIPEGKKAGPVSYAHAWFLSSSVAVRRALAAECSAFLLDLDDKDECWIPYDKWAESLGQDDAVISFNYDLVLEKLAAKRGSKLKVLLPSECPGGGSPLPEDVVPVLKLHGSVDWKRDKDGPVVRGDVKEILVFEMEAPFIAAPGRSKQDAVLELGPLWTYAKWALKHAKALVVLGYGFPATDTRARVEIQTAFTSGSSGRDIRRIDLVVGPDTSRPEVQRVRALLEAFRGREPLVVAPEKVRPENGGALYVKTHHLLAEDFIFDYVQRTRDD